jgi:hypothetical protein
MDRIKRAIQGSRSIFSRWFPRLLNLLTVIAAAVLISQYWTRLSGHDAVGDNGPPPGSTIAVPGMDWAASERTLILALQVSCPYCKQSMAFYRSLLRTASPATLHIVAILPDTVQESKAYLEGSALPITDIRQINLESLGIAGTPTLLIVNRQGRIEDSWAGKLSRQQEDRVFNRLHLRRALLSAETAPGSKSSVPDSDPDLVSLQQLGSAWQRAQLIDTRTRQEFTNMRAKQSLNIPMDELEIRLAHEVSADHDVLFLCKSTASCRTPPSDGVISDCGLVRLIVRKIPGFSRARYLSTRVDQFSPKDVQIGEIAGVSNE